MRMSVSLIALCACGALGIVPEAIAADSTAKAAVTQTAAASDPSAAARSLESEVQRAHALRVQGNFAEATRVLSQLMLAYPDDPRVVGEYGKTLAQTGQSKDAIAFLKRAAELQPSDWTLYSALGVAYDQADDPKNAKAAYDRALTLNPRDPAVLNNYAVSRMLAGDLNGAEKMLAQARASGPTYPKIATNMAILDQMTGARTASGVANQASAPAASAPAPGVKQPMATVAVGSAGPRDGEAKDKRSQPVINANLQQGKSARSVSLQAAAKEGTVVMQRVPVDPQAGPVATPGKPPRKLSAPRDSKATAKIAKSVLSAPAALRTADEGE